MVDLVKRQASLLSPRTTAVTGSLLQDKPEDAVVPDPAKIQVAPVAAPAPVETPVEPEATPVAPQVSSVPEEAPVLTEQEQHLNTLDTELEALLQAEKDNEKRKITKASKMDQNLEALEKGNPTVEVEEEVDYVDMAEDTLWAGVRGVNQGVGWMLDLVPTGILQGVELVDNHLMDDQLDTSRYQNVVQRFMDDRWGTSDSYKTNAVAEVAGDVGEAVPLMAVTGAAMARYGLNQIANGKALNQYVAPYALRLGQSLGIDVAAVTAGETMEEIVEEVAGEDSLWGTGANIVTSIYSGARLQRIMQSDEALKAQASLTKVNGQQVTIGGSGFEATEEAPSGIVGLTDRGKEKALSLLEKMPLTKAVFKDFAQANGNFVEYNRELRLLGRSGKKHLRELWNKTLTSDERAQFLANMEMASSIGLKLTPYELLGHESLRPLALATAKITPEASLKRIDDNLMALDKLLAKDSPELSEVARDQLKKALGTHNKEIDDTVDVIRQNLKVRKQDILDDIAEQEMANDPAVIGKEFSRQVSKYVDDTKAIFGRQFDEAVDGEQMVRPQKFAGQLVSSLEHLSKGTFTLPTKAGKLVTDILQAATPTRTPEGAKVYQKVKVGDLMKARSSLNKALGNLNFSDPMFQQHKQSLFNAIEAIDGTLGQTLPQESLEALEAAKNNWRINVGERFNQRETKKLVTRDAFNEPFYNGQEMLEVLFSGSDKATKSKAYAEFLGMRKEALEEFSDGDEAAAVVNAMEDAKLHIKQYMVNQMISDIALKRDVPVDEVVQGYMQRNSHVFDDLLDGTDFDPGKLIRDVEKGVEDLQKAEMDMLARKLNLGSSDEIFDLKSYLNKTVLENEAEANRLVRLMDNPTELQKLGMTKEAMQEMFSSTIMRDVIGADVNGRALDTNIRKLLEKAPGKLEKLLGEDRVAHMRKFLVGHKLATKIKPSEVRTTRVENLDHNVAEDLGLGMIPSFVSDRLVIAKRIASAHYVHTMRAVKIIGGLSSNGYKKFMVRTMTDPEFFMDVIKFRPQTHDDVKRIRLYLAAQGIDTSVKTKEEVNEQQRILEQAHAETEGSMYDNDESLVDVLNDTMGIEPEVETEGEPEVEPEETKEEEKPEE